MSYSRREAHRLQRRSSCPSSLAARTVSAPGIALEEVVEAAVLLDDVDDVLDLPGAGRTRARVHARAAPHVRQAASRSSRPPSIAPAPARGDRVGRKTPSFATPYSSSGATESSCKRRMKNFGAMRRVDRHERARGFWRNRSSRRPASSRARRRRELTEAEEILGEAQHARRFVLHVRHVVLLRVGRDHEQRNPETQAVVVSSGGGTWS